MLIGSEAMVSLQYSTIPDCSEFTQALRQNVDGQIVLTLSKWPQLFNPGSRIANLSSPLLKYAGAFALVWIATALIGFGLSLTHVAEWKRASLTSLELREGTITEIESISLFNGDSRFKISGFPTWLVVPAEFIDKSDLSHVPKPWLRLGQTVFFKATFQGIILEMVLRSGPNSGQAIIRYDLSTRGYQSFLQSQVSAGRLYLFAGLFALLGVCIFLMGTADMKLRLVSTVGILKVKFNKFNKLG